MIAKRVERDMKYRLLDLLACPICKHFPLDLLVLKETPLEEGSRWPRCEEYCGLLAKPVSEVERTPCEECYRKEVEEGVLLCSKCGRWYPIIEGIPHMLPDELRDEKEDRAFLERYADRLPKKLLEEGRPTNLKG